MIIHGIFSLILCFCFVLLRYCRNRTLLRVCIVLYVKVSNRVILSYHRVKQQQKRVFLVCMFSFSSLLSCRMLN